MASTLATDPAGSAKGTGSSAGHRLTKPAYQAFWLLWRSFFFLPVRKADRQALNMVTSVVRDSGSSTLPARFLSLYHRRLGGAPSSTEHSCDVQAASERVR
jgi:hypothetical protein